MENKSIIIIGAGMAGLSAGCYSQMNGYNTQIFEMHTAPGGLCTSWKRKGYTFDGCIHWLVGSNPERGFNQIWRELGAVQNREIVDHEVFNRVEDREGNTLIVYTNIERLEKHMLDHSPGDSSLIKEFTGAARRLKRLSTTPAIRSGGIGGIVKGIGAFLKILPLMGLLKKYSKISIQDFAARFSDPFLRFALPRITGFELPDMPLIAIVSTLALLHDRNAGYPIGGSLEFSRAIERRYLDLGGQILYKSRVEKILVEGNRAVGVRLADGSEYRADYVVSAADGHATIFEMLEGKYVDDEIRTYYEELEPFPPLVLVSLGVARDFSEEPHTVYYSLDRPITIADKAHDYILIRHFCYDPTLAPPGKSSFVMFFPTEYEYWKELSKDKERYRAEKNEIATAVIDRLEVRWPGFAEKVESIDVATPMTFERFTGNWRGSFEGWLITTKTARLAFGKGMKKTLPGLDNFYMIGHWTQPGGGLPPAAQMGRSIIERICMRDRKRFEAQIQ